MNIGFSSFGKFLEWQGEGFVVNFKDSESFSSYMTGGGQGDWRCALG